MIDRVVAAIALLLIPASPVFATGCPAKDGTVYPAIEEMNQHLLDGEYDKFVAALSSNSGGGINLDMSGIASVFPEGFDSCTTIAQRVERESMSQNVVVFRSKGNPLYLYWLIVPVKVESTVYSVSLNTDAKALLKNLN